MLKSFVKLQNEIMSILVESEQAKHDRLTQQDCNIMRSHDEKIKIKGSNSAVSLLNTLESIVGFIKSKGVYSSYYSELEKIEPVMQKIKAEELAIQMSNLSAQNTRKNIIQDMDFLRNEKIAKLIGSNIFYNVKVKTGKISQVKIDALNSFFAERGFTGPEIIEGYSVFTGLSEENSSEITVKILKLIKNQTGYFIRQEVLVEEEDIVKHCLEKSLLS